jgi:chaperonin cofactor prefoldin
MSAKEIIREIEKLPIDDKAEVFLYVGEQLNSEKKKYALEILEKLKGRGKNILDLEPQEYISVSREDDRI